MTLRKEELSPDTWGPLPTLPPEVVGDSWSTLQCSLGPLCVVTQWDSAHSMAKFNQVSKQNVMRPCFNILLQAM